MGLAKAKGAEKWPSCLDFMHNFATDFSMVDPLTSKAVRIQDINLTHLKAQL